MRTIIPWIIAVLVLLASLTLGAFQQPQPIPPYPGDDNPQHDNQPSWCQNADSGGHAANCSCKPVTGDPACNGKEPDDEETSEMPRCKVWCRPKSCRCQKSCERTR